MTKVERSRARARAASSRLRRWLGNESYAGADLANAARVVGAIWSLSALLTAIFLALDPPTQAIGDAGWALAGAVVIGGFGAGRRLRTHLPPPGFDDLLAIGYLGLAQVALLEWLSGGAFETAYHELYLLWVGAAMGVHPARRALLFLVVTIFVAAAPLAYGDWSEHTASVLAADVLIWTTLGLVVLSLMTHVRGQRVTLREQEHEAQELARADALTGLANRRAFDEALAAELGRSRRAGSTASVAIIDLDDFKQINDRFGHLDGDRCLRDTAAAIRRALRDGDRAFRWAGDEFAVLLPDTTYTGAEDAVARIAMHIADACAAADGSPLSVSWGVAEAGPGMDADDLLGAADLALMGMKRERQQAQGAS